MRQRAGERPNVVNAVPYALNTNLGGVPGMSEQAFVRGVLDSGEGDESSWSHERARKNQESNPTHQPF